jgi:hypothetical protein
VVKDMVIAHGDKGLAAASAAPAWAWPVERGLAEGGAR